MYVTAVFLSDCVCVCVCVCVSGPQNISGVFEGSDWAWRFKELWDILFIIISIIV